MTASTNKAFDAIDNLIFEEGLRITALGFQFDLDLVTIYLNTRVALSQDISTYKSLQGADRSALLNYELIGDGVGVHWPALDEDLSLRGFLQNELRKVIGKRHV
jgi:hypothetical protein